MTKTSFLLKYLQEQRNVRPFVETKYVSNEPIPCQFGLYRVDISNGSVSQQERVCYLEKEEYIRLLAILVIYPNITFQDLPIYINKELYEKLLVHLRFPRYEHICNVSSDLHYSSPIAVEMITLQQDLREYAGEERYSFALLNEATERFCEVALYFNCRKIEVKAVIAEEKQVRFLEYRDIDAIEVQNILGVSDYRGVETALNQIFETLPTAQKTNVLWFIQWLDENKVKYHLSEQVSH